MLWLRGLNPGNRSYRATFIFENTLGGCRKARRCVIAVYPVGRVSDIRPNANEVAVIAEITQSDLRIPSDSRIEANQSGLIGETTIDITPSRNLNPQELAMSPVGDDCNGELIICNGDQLQGQVGASYESLIRSAEELANAFADPEILNDFKTYPPKHYPIYPAGDRTDR